MSRSRRRVPAPLHFTQRADAGAVFFHTNSNYNKELREVIENRTEGTRRSEGSWSQSDRENTSLRGARVAVGTRRHITSKGPGSPPPNPCRLEGGKGEGRVFEELCAIIHNFPPGLSRVPDNISHKNRKFTNGRSSKYRLQQRAPQKTDAPWRGGWNGGGGGGGRDDRN